MRVHLRYGSRGLSVEVPRGTTVLRPMPVAPLRDPRRRLAQALRRCRLPQGRGRRHPRAAVVVSDVTRAMPNETVLGPILARLEAQGVRDTDVTIIIATGLHRRSREAERERILGRAIARRYRVVDHVARDPATHAYLCTSTRGTRVDVCRDYLDADFRILTGFVEPHLFAGYSGGGKAVLPGIASAEAILANHCASMIGHPRAVFCETEGNPIFEEIREVALASKPSLVVNVTLDDRRRITGVFAGDLTSAHDAAIAQAARQARRPLPHRYDLVVATNMGYPADLLLYQSVKGVALARLACAPDGAILLCAECREGLGSQDYVDLLHSRTSPAAILRRLRRARSPIIDQWQVQVQVMAQQHHEVALCSSLTRDQVRGAHLRYAASVEGWLRQVTAERRRALGRTPTLCVLPHGQLAVPQVLEEVPPEEPASSGSRSARRRR